MKSTSIASNNLFASSQAKNQNMASKINFNSDLSNFDLTTRDIDNKHSSKEIDNLQSIIKDPNFVWDHIISTIEISENIYTKSPSKPYSKTIESKSDRK